MNPIQQLLQQTSTNQTLIPILLLWSTVWKGLALWGAAKNEQKYWFIPLLVINLFGLPEIAYLFFFQKEGRWLEKIKKE